MIKRLIFRQIFKYKIIKFNLYKIMSKKNSESKKKIKPIYEEEEINKSVEEILEKESYKKSSLNKLDLIKNYESQEKINKMPISKMPKDFKKVWKFVEEMRGRYQAPVDTMGCESVSAENLDRPAFKFQTIISLLLSSQTKDPITFATMDKLISHGLSIDNIIATKEETIKDMIYGVSFHNNKAKFIKKLAQKLKDDFNSDPPEDLKELLSLPGIGPKMAHIYLQYACNKVEGIAVDTHVHRICNRLKWVNETKTPEHTRKELETWLPKDHWTNINLLLVGFGQTICAAVAPKCQECKLNNSCEFGIERLKKLKEKSSKSRSKSKEKVENIIEHHIHEGKKSAPKLISDKTISKENKDLSSLKSNVRKNINSKSPTPVNGKRKK